MEPDESGCINFNEFVKIMSGGYEPDEKIIARNMFFDFDKDKDGLISFEEFKLMAKFFFKSANIDELEKDFNSIDLNGDGKLSLEGSLNYYSFKFCLKIQNNYLFTLRICGLLRIK